MKRIPISDSDCRLNDESYALMMAFAFYPEQEEERNQLIWLGRNESERRDRIGEENYVPSEVILATYRVLENRFGRMLICGLVANVMTIEEGRQRPTSLLHASKVVACLTGSTSKINVWRLGRGSNWRPGFLRLNADPKDIRDCFREYKSVSHIWGAIAGAGEYVDPKPTWGRAPELQNSLIWTAYCYEVFLRRCGVKDIWSLESELTPSMPWDLQGYPALLPSNEMVQAICQASDEVLGAKKPGISPS